MLQFRTSLAYLDDYDNKNRPRAVEEEEKKRVAQRKDLPKGLVSAPVRGEPQSWSPVSEVYPTQREVPLSCPALAHSRCSRLY